MPNYTITRILFQPPLESAVNVNIYYKYYLDTSYTLLLANAAVDTDGYITPTATVPAEYNTRYTIKVVNEQCDLEYTEDIFLPGDTDSFLWVNWDYDIFLNGHVVGMGGTYTGQQPL